MFLDRLFNRVEPAPLPGELRRVVWEEIEIFPRENGTVVYCRRHQFCVQLTTVKRLADELRGPFELSSAHALEMARIIVHKARWQARQETRPNWVTNYRELY